MKRLGQKFLVPAVAVSIGLLLTSCDPFPAATGSLTIRVGESGIEIAVCEEFRAETVLFDYRRPGEDWVSTSWSGLDQTLEPEELIRLPTTPELPDASALVEGTEIYVLVNDGSTVADSRFILDGEPIDDRWLQPSGARLESPCSI